MHGAVGRSETDSVADPYPTEYQFAGGVGYQREPEGAAGLGLDYLYQRYYDSASGRFISRDPIGYAGGLNLYGYCAGNPVNWVDPLGLGPRNINCAKAMGLIKRIQQLSYEIAKREREIREDVLKLPSRVPGGKLRDSKEGHRRLINMDKAMLAAARAELIQEVGIGIVELLDKTGYLTFVATAGVASYRAMPEVERLLQRGEASAFPANNPRDEFEEDFRSNVRGLHPRNRR